jgi:hypothetical protein
VAIALMSGCTPEADRSPAAAGAVPASGAASVAAPSPAPAGLDAATKKACDELLDAVKETAASVAKAEKIGPPAGHYAVGAAYQAGAAQLSAASIDATDKRVLAAVDQVSTAMQDLDAAQQKDPEGKPSKAKLKSAVAELKEACAA